MVKNCILISACLLLVSVQNSYSQSKRDRAEHLYELSGFEYKIKLLLEWKNINFEKYDKIFSHDEIAFLRERFKEFYYLGRFREAAITLFEDKIEHDEAKQTVNWLKSPIGISLTQAETDLAKGNLDDKFSVLQLMIEIVKSVISQDRDIYDERMGLSSLVEINGTERIIKETPSWIYYSLISGIQESFPADRRRSENKLQKLYDGEKYEISRASISESLGYIHYRTDFIRCFRMDI